ncbi:hypothetical protein T258_3926 (plasmid) [Clostridium sporogenes]|nr:hypothetical protein T258_3926 [Clostridium botulinum Prevot_594]
MISIKRKDEIWNAIYAEPCLLDFNKIPRWKTVSNICWR